MYSHEEKVGQTATVGGFREDVDYLRSESLHKTLDSWDVAFQHDAKGRQGVAACFVRGPLALRTNLSSPKEIANFGPKLWICHRYAKSSVRDHIVRYP